MELSLIYVLQVEHVFCVLILLLCMLYDTKNKRYPHNVVTLSRVVNYTNNNEHLLDRLQPWRRWVFLTCIYLNCNTMCYCTIEGISITITKVLLNNLRAWDHLFVPCRVHISLWLWHLNHLHLCLASTWLLWQFWTNETNIKPNRTRKYK